ncbi:DNA-binding transcriptional regulator DhaR [Citrobacter braakii]|nr:DNA-binding transcriptional regulator DhaR [Citrobacter braakii]
MRPTDDENGRLSRLELANGGTLFLEKIEYLAPELQSALLQVIKQGVLTRLDARRLIPVDVKVIATPRLISLIWWSKTALAVSCITRCTLLRS